MTIEIRRMSAWIFTLLYLSAAYALWSISREQYRVVKGLERVQRMEQVLLSRQFSQPEPGVKPLTARPEESAAQRFWTYLQELIDLSFFRALEEIQRLSFPGR